GTFLMNAYGDIIKNAQQPAAIPYPEIQEYWSCLVRRKLQHIGESCGGSPIKALAFGMAKSNLSVNRRMLPRR
ncbi:MAG: hypothetical protein WKF37_04410, partial [Bryobacteraceae bacterium]